MSGDRVRAAAFACAERLIAACEALAALAMPMLLVSSRQTLASHAEVFRNGCAAMPHAEVVHVDSAGHGVSWDQPAAFNRRVLALLGAVRN